MFCVLGYQPVQNSWHLRCMPRPRQRKAAAFRIAPWQLKASGGSELQADSAGDGTQAAVTLNTVPNTPLRPVSGTRLEHLLDRACKDLEAALPPVRQCSFRGAAEIVLRPDGSLVGAEDTSHDLSMLSLRL